MPPWEAEGIRYYLPPEVGRNENATVPDHPAVMSPLLVWALRFTEDFAADILAALAEQQRLQSHIAPAHSADAATRLAALIDEHARPDTPLLGETIKGRRSAACCYLAGLTGSSLTQAHNAVRRACLPVADAAPLDIPVTGTVHGTPWLSQISCHQAQALALRLAAACLIVVAYLSGLRPAEVLQLHASCCPAPQDDGTGTMRYRLHGHHFKGVRDANGTPAPGGAPRCWTVIRPVHTAMASPAASIVSTAMAVPSRAPATESGAYGVVVGAAPRPFAWVLITTAGDRAGMLRTGQGARIAGYECRLLSRNL